MGFIENLNSAMIDKRTSVCCGLDPDMKKFPIALQQPNSSAAIAEFLQAAVRLTIEHVCAYKIQKAFFDLHEEGHLLLKQIIVYIRSIDANVPIIIDCKIGDIENTMQIYMQTIFESLRADAVVLNPYMGADVWTLLAQYPSKGALILVRTSNPSAAIIQDVILQNGESLWLYVLKLVAAEWLNGYRMIPILSEHSGVVFRTIRKEIPDEMPIFLAGFGAQGRTLESIKCLTNSEGHGVIVNSSRGILYSYEPQSANWQNAIEQSVIAMKNNLNRVCI